MIKVVPTTVGFIGTGKTSSKNINALLSDYVDAKSGNVKFVIPFSVAEFTETIEYVFQFALDYDIDVVAICDKTTEGNKKLREIVEALGDSHVAENVVKGVTGKLIASDNPNLIIAWDDEDESCLEALDLAVNHGILSLDLTTGLQELEFDEPMDSGKTTTSGDTEVLDDEQTTDTSATQQEELLVPRISTDSGGSEVKSGVAEEERDDDLGEELDAFVPFHRVLERLKSIEDKLDEILKRSAL